MIRSFFVCPGRLRQNLIFLQRKWSGAQQQRQKSLMSCSFETCRELLIVYRPTLSIYQPTFEKYRHLPSYNTL